MNGGYMGRILNVDLSTGDIKEERLDEKLCRDFVGGYGIGARLIYTRQKAKADPLGPDNILGFMTGPLTGTPAITGSRFTVMGKSPLTGTWGDANCGGYFGANLKFAGYDGAFFIGMSEKPVYLFIDEGKAELRDAAHLWGKDTSETVDLIQSELGKGIEVACIGPSGEQLFLISGIISQKGRAAARSGLGAVMGSKRLKAIAVRGTKKIPLANKERVDQIRRRLLKEFEGPLADMFKKYGTCGITAAWTMIGETPVKNHSGIGSVDFPQVTAISDENVIKYEERKYACYRCPVACGGHVRVKEGPYALEGHKPEHETLAAFGTMCLNSNVESIIKLNDMCNRYGLDTISTGSTIAFAIECYEKGLITKEDTQGIELTWGNHQAIVAMTEKMAKRDGFGDILADGVKVAAEKIGKGAQEYAMHIQGQEVPMRDARGIPGIATTYKMDATPARHTKGGAHWAEGISTPDIGVTTHERYDYSGKGQNHKKLSTYMDVVNSAGLCMYGLFLFDASFVYEFLSAVTGREWTLEDTLKTGERIANIRQAFNIREGLNPLEFKVPDRILGKPPLKEGTTADVEVDIDTQIREYLETMDWDLVTARPSKGKLLELGLEDVATDLY